MMNKSQIENLIDHARRLPAHQAQEYIKLLGILRAELEADIAVIDQAAEIAVEKQLDHMNRMYSDL